MSRPLQKDSVAFEKVKGRLQGDAGRLIQAAGRKNTTPFWAFARMLFPIAESIGDLMYLGSSADNLVKVLEEGLGQPRPYYKGKQQSLP